MLRRIWAITQKELIQLRRDPTILILMLFLPIIQLALFAAAIHTDIQHIPMMVADQSMSAASRDYIDALVRSDYFTIIGTATSQDELMAAIDSGRASVGLLIPPDFTTKLPDRQAQVLILIDGSDSYTTNTAYSTANAISESYAVSLIRQSVTPLNLDIRILYNPDLNQLWFLVPGLLAALVQAIALSLTALAVVREREVGTIEALLVTPIRPIELMIGKTLPNLAIALVNTTSILLVATQIFGVPFQGNLLLFFGLSLVFSFSGLGLGLVISVAAQSQMQAQQLAMMLNFVGMFLAGFLFPPYALPAPLRVIGAIFPMTYFLPILRGIYTKGVGLSALAGQVVASLGLLIVILFAAARLFRESLD
ncbi:MAG: ABC transporter permease [Caldilineaceae bacterium]|nr:ABC transporter permease [Caldilineaceae bacterium]